MLFEINKDFVVVIEFVLMIQVVSDIDFLKVILIENIEFVFCGKIIDDLVRGIIFWEVDGNDLDVEFDVGSEVLSQFDDFIDEGGKIWGKFFKLEWLFMNWFLFY